MTNKSVKTSPGRPEAIARIKSDIIDIEKRIQAKSNKAEKMIADAGNGVKPIPAEVDKLIGEIAGLKDEQKKLNDKLGLLIAGVDANNQGLKDDDNDQSDDDEFLGY